MMLGSMPTKWGDQRGRAHPAQLLAGATILVGIVSLFWHVTKHHDRLGPTPCGSPIVRFFSRPGFVWASCKTIVTQRVVLGGLLIGLGAALTVVVKTWGRRKDNPARST